MKMNLFFLAGITCLFFATTTTAQNLPQLGKNSIKDVIAKSKNLNEWKFIVMEEDKMPFLKKIVPKELLE